MMRSLRQELLPKDTADLIAHWLTLRIGGRFMVSAVEVKLDGDEFVRHPFSETEPSHFVHADDPNWAVVVREDHTGDADRGRQILSISRIRLL
jgi:hypothetical protein